MPTPTGQDLTDAINSRNNMLSLTFPSKEEIQGWSKHTANEGIKCLPIPVTPEVYDMENDRDEEQENEYFDYL